MRSTIKTKQRGFTLLELAITIIVIGVVSMVLSPLFDSYATSQKRSYDEKQNLVNLATARALMSYAANSTSQGRIPDSYTGNGYVRTVLDPTNTVLASALTSEGLNSNEINSDGYASQRVRVYQQVSGLTATVPLYFQSGPNVSLLYEYGAIYIVDCAKADGTCNPTPATGVPGSSPLMTATNFSTWESAGTDSRATIVSSLPLQKSMLATTVQRLDKVRDALLAYLRGQQVTAAAGDTTNWFPPNPGTMGGLDPSLNQGCRDGWYDLSSAAVNVLPTVGLSREEFGMTAWGGRIEYCRDYDPTFAGPPNSAPHYAALRINKSPSNGAAGNAPDAAILGNNIVLTF